MTPGRDDPFGFARSLSLVRREPDHPGLAGYDPLDRLLAACLDTVPGAEAAAISFADGTTVRSVHATDPVVAVLDQWHAETGHGPLLDRGPAPVTANFPVRIIDDLAEPAVWGATTFASAPPFRSLCSSTLRNRHGRRTALDLYACARGIFGLDTVVLADLFAQHAAHTLYGAPEPATRDDRAVNALSSAVDPPTRDTAQLLRAHLVDRTKHGLDIAARLINPDDNRAR